MISWREADLVEFFGTNPVYHDDAHSHSFELSRDGLRFLLTLFDLEGAVYVSIWRDQLPEPLFTVVRESCTHALVVNDTRGRVCLEVGSTEFPTNDIGISLLLVRGIRVFVQPQFQVEFIDVEQRSSTNSLASRNHL